MRTFYNALKFVFDQHAYRFIGAIAFVLFFIAYLFILPATYTAGHIGLISLHYLTWGQGIIALVLSLLMGILVPVIVFSYRMGGSSSKASSAGGLFASMITPFLCCTAVIPSIIGVIAGILPIIPGTMGIYVQAIIATHELEIYLFAIFLLVVSLYQNIRKVISCPGCKIDSEGTPYLKTE